MIYIYNDICKNKNTHTTSKSVCVCVQKNMYIYIYMNANDVIISASRHINFVPNPNRTTES